MKKQKLQVDFEFDFDVFGIVSTYKDYKLAWNINNSLRVSLHKENDITINFVDSELVVSHFKYSTEGSEMQVLRNKSYELSGGENQFLIPEMPQIDYFVMIQGEVGGHDESEIQSMLKKTQGVEFVMKLDVEKLKSRENFIF
jgi:hypothetical protein